MISFLNAQNISSFFLLSLDPGRPPSIVLGKPNPMFAEAILSSRQGLSKEGTVVIGDKLDTDIALGIESGLGGTCLVLTGVDGLKSEGPRPLYFLNSLGELSDWFTRSNL